ncbi:hypothetical protein Tco_1180057 [Tanacetum coccineum]
MAASDWPATMTWHATWHARGKSMVGQWPVNAVGPQVNGGHRRSTVVVNDGQRRCTTVDHRRTTAGTVVGSGQQLGQRNLLKQQYENFTASSSKVLDQTFDRLQNLISQLEIHGESISQEDVNKKFLRSLSPE